MTKYFKGLDTLRAVAALVVVWGHIELNKKERSIPNLIDKNFILFPDAHIAVVLFFALSGFLITYLLVKERENSGKISFRNFYMRRILRIWPLYYTVMLLSYFIIKYNYTPQSLVLCLSIFPNFAHAMGYGWASSPQIWSIGVEEQFYLFWPLFLSILPDKKVIPGLIIFFIGYSLLPHLFDFINTRTYQNNDVGGVVNRFFNGTKFNCMAVGSLMGYSLAKEKNWIKVFSHDLIVIFSILASFVLWFFHIDLKYFTDEFFSVIFSFMIIGVATTKRISIDTGISRFLGRISYGIYMYHWIVIFVIFKLISFDNNQILFNSIVYPAVFAGTILVSWVSNITLERYFMNFKKRF